MTFIKHSLYAVIAAACLPLAAQATTSPTFDFYLDGGSGGIDTVSTSPNFVKGGLSVTIRAYGADGKQVQVTDRWDGLGVSSGLLNEITNGEYLTLTFNKAVNLTGLQFSYWENSFLGLGGDKASLSWGSKSLTLGDGNDGGLFVKGFSFSNVSGTTFTIRGTSSLSLFRLAGITATAAVPEPATYGLMGLGLLGVAATVRRRKA